MSRSVLVSIDFKKHLLGNKITLAITKQGGWKRHQESDGGVVPKKAGNTAGGKAATRVTVL
jgi:hypothetical protein